MVEPPRDDEVIGHVLIEETDMDERDEDVQGHSHTFAVEDDEASNAHGISRAHTAGATDDDVEGHSHTYADDDDDVKGHSHTYADDDDDVKGHQHN